MHAGIEEGDWGGDGPTTMIRVGLKWSAGDIGDRDVTGGSREREGGRIRIEAMDGRNREREKKSAHLGDCRSTEESRINQSPLAATQIAQSAKYQTTASVHTSCMSRLGGINIYHARAIKG